MLRTGFASTEEINLNFESLGAHMFLKLFFLYNLIISLLFPLDKWHGPSLEIWNWIPYILWCYVSNFLETLLVVLEKISKSSEYNFTILLLSPLDVGCGSLLFPMQWVADFPIPATGQISTKFGIKYFWVEGCKSVQMKGHILFDGEIIP